MEHRRFGSVCTYLVVQGNKCYFDLALIGLAIATAEQPRSKLLLLLLRYDRKLKYYT